MPNGLNLHDVHILEGEAEATPQEAYQALQRAINAGMWSLQGSYGRTMMAAIESGHCMLGENPARDYWGNFIPSRSMVQEHTKGSRSYVADQMGEEWAAAMEAA